MGLLGAYWLVGLVDARTPLLVADAQGIRIRLGRTWRGLPWTAVHHVEHTPRQGLLRDGRLVVVPHNLELIEAELTGAGKRHTSISRLLHGAPFAVPLGLSTRVIGADGDLTEALGRVARDASQIVVLEPAAAEARTPRSAEARTSPSTRPRPREASEALEAPRHPCPRSPRSSSRSSSPARRRPRSARPAPPGAPRCARRRSSTRTSRRVASCAAPAGSASWRRPSRGATASARSPGRASRSSRWCSTTSRSSPPRTRSSDPSSPRPAPAWA